MAKSSTSAAANGSTKSVDQTLAGKKRRYSETNLDSSKDLSKKTKSAKSVKFSSKPMGPTGTNKPVPSDSVRGVLIKDKKEKAESAKPSTNKQAATTIPSAESPKKAKSGGKGVNGKKGSINDIIKTKVAPVVSAPELIMDDSDIDSEDEHLADEAAIQKGKLFIPTKLPTVAKDDESIRRRLKMAKARPSAEKGVIYVGRIPHGFFEDQMKAYFGQFGEVTRLRVSRNKRTGASKHYAFVEFANSAVAAIVQDTMDNYLLYGRILRVKIIPPGEVHEALWVGANRKFRPVPTDRLERLSHNAARDEKQQKKVLKRAENRIYRATIKAEKRGINYSFD